MKTRIITAIIGLIIVLPIIIYGRLPFIVIAYLLALIGLFELIRMYKPKGIFTYLLFSILFLVALIYPSNTITFFDLTLDKGDILLLLGLFLLSLTVFTKNKFNFNDAGFLLITTMYIGLSFFYLIEVRSAGLNYLLFILFVIWSTDSGAYFFGKAFGKRKLWPEISPNKTIGGALGGILMAVVVGIIYQVVYPFDFSLVVIVLYALLISVVGQVGDLVASGFKRHYDVKDAGNLFPGHGGVLDRLDSLIFVMLVLYIIEFV
ncbi:MAG TPA: phosphatidate cytidylyltransferase [Pseudogracilibacillus sp.]|nr:phosphatidate cytidylyltransferase [Pseudogracilibacillus sp.]